jgi:hypothetical protein
MCSASRPQFHPDLILTILFILSKIAFDPGIAETSAFSVRRSMFDVSRKNPPLPVAGAILQNSPIKSGLFGRFPPPFTRLLPYRHKMCNASLPSQSPLYPKALHQGRFNTSTLQR